MSAPRFTEERLGNEVWPRFSRVMRRGEIYLANHSLGRPPDRVAEDVRAALDAWYADMDGAWKHWLSSREKFRSLTAKLVHAPRADCIVPKTSAGQGLRAVLNALPGKPRVVTSDGEFDSIDFILRVYREKGRIDLRIVPWRELSPAGFDQAAFAQHVDEVRQHRHPQRHHHRVGRRHGHALGHVVEVRRHRQPQRDDHRSAGRLRHGAGNANVHARAVSNNTKRAAGPGAVPSAGARPDTRRAMPSRRSSSTPSLSPIRTRVSPVTA